MRFTSKLFLGSLVGVCTQFAAPLSAQELNESGQAVSATALVPPEDSTDQLAEAVATEATATAYANPMPTSPTPAPAPKKKAPPAFPGAKVLPPTGPWKPLYFDNDFSFKKDPNHEYVFGEELKDIRFGLTDCDQCFSFSTGGEIRHRYMNEDNRLRPGGPAQADNQLIRWRHYGDLKYSDWLRGYVEGIHADSFGNDLPDQPIDVNRWDLLNAFVDVAFLEDDFGTHTVRYGRQELLFGRQRMVSPLDWGNTRRNFEGVRYMHKGDTHRFDAFAVNPVNTATGFRTVAAQDNKFDTPVTGVWFSGEAVIF